MRGAYPARAAGRRELAFLAEQTRGVLEAYRAVCQVAEDPELDLHRKALLAAAQECFDQACLLGEAERFESANETTFQNAIDLLLGQSILETRRVEVASERRRKKAPVVETHYAPGEHAERLLPLRARLDAALDAL